MVLEVEEGDFSVVTGDKIVTPQALTIPERLAHLRVVIHDIIGEYNIQRAGIRLIEITAENQSIERVRIEAVIQEALAGSTVRGYFTGRLNSIAARVPGNHSAADLKAILRSANPYLGIPDWSDFSVEMREALLVAIAGLEERE